MIGETVFLNGVYMARDSASISPFDRGFLFADSVYEMLAVYEGRMLHEREHLARLARSLSALGFPPVQGGEELAEALAGLIARNGLRSGRVYVQISRGNGGSRAFLPPDGIVPSVFAYTESADILDTPGMREGIAVITLPEQRWARRDIKSNNLLAQCLAYQSVSEQGVDDALMVEDGYVTEAISANAWIVGADGVLHTRSLSEQILAGVTREMILSHLPSATKLEERAFTPQQARAAAEVFISSASRLVVPVVSIDGSEIGSGCPGPWTRRMQTAYMSAAGLAVPDWLHS